MSLRGATSAWNNIYKALSMYPSERVALVIARRRQHGLFVSVRVVREALEAEALVVAVQGTSLPQDDTWALQRAHNACTARKDTLDEKIARCMVRKGVEAVEPPRPHSGWGYHEQYDDR